MTSHAGEGLTRSAPMCSRSQSHCSVARRSIQMWAGRSTCRSRSMSTQPGDWALMQTAAISPGAIFGRSMATRIVSAPARQK